MRKPKPKSTWGGKRIGAGRPRSTGPRCACGKFTRESAEANRHKCRLDG